jgi:hypothetical protein
MDLKAFAMRNKTPLAQLGLAAVLMLLGFLMLQMSFSSPTIPQLKDPSSNLSRNTTLILPNEPLEPGPNCSPLYNIGYAYEVDAPTPQGYMRVLISYNYAGEESVLGTNARIIEIGVNSSLNGSDMNSVTRSWLNYETGACIKSQLDLGKGNVYPIDCKNSRFSLLSVPCREQLEGFSPTGTQSIKVPAGEFLAEKYEREGNQTIWFTKDIPVPIKFTFKSLGEFASAKLLYYRETK